MHAFGVLLEDGFVSDPIIGNAVHFTGEVLEWNAGVDQYILFLRLPVWKSFDSANLYDAVVFGVYAGGFQVEEDDGAFELHSVCFVRACSNFGARYSQKLLKSMFKKVREILFSQGKFCPYGFYRAAGCGSEKFNAGWNKICRSPDH